MIVSPLTLVGFQLHAWRRGLGNFALFYHRDCAGHLLSMHQSGTHWLKFMLANALSYQYGTPAPAYNHANDIIGGPRDAVVYPQLPRLIASHSIAPAVLAHAAVHRWFALPRYVVLVRDVRAALMSNYLKWRQRYGVSFSDYLRGDIAGRRYNSDLWWALRFLNAWGEVVQHVPARVAVVRYEDLERDAARELTRVATHFALALAPVAIAHGAASADKAAMQARDDPARPPGAVRIDDREPSYSDDDRAFVTAVCARCLRHPFGYDYRVWP